MTTEDVKDSEAEITETDGAEAAPAEATGDDGAGAADTGEEEPFDPAAALAELEAAMADTDAVEPAGGSEGYIKILEDEVMQLTALVESSQIAVKAANTRADEAHEQVELAKARMKREAELVLQRRTRKVLLAFVEVLDDLERALGSAREMDHNPEVVSGVELVQRRFMTQLKTFGVEKQVVMGARFDPTVHDAVSMIPVADADQDGLVVAVTVDGYVMGDELLRPAAVVVGKAG